MTNVHEAITAHSKKQHQHIKQFVRLEQEREKAIDDVVDKCRRNEAFSTDLINQITVQMNELAKKASFPQDGSSRRKWLPNTSAENIRRPSWWILPRVASCVFAKHKP